LEVFGGFDTLNIFVTKTRKGTSLGESASFKVYIVKLRSPVFAAGDDKKKERKRKVYTKSQLTSRLYFSNMGSRPRWIDFRKKMAML